MRWHAGLAGATQVTAGIPTFSQDEIDYPSSDGEPMAETPLHGAAMVSAMQELTRHYASRADVTVGMNMLFYYEEGRPAARFAPDVYVAVGAPKRHRRTYKTWVEPVPPNFVLEVSSKGTWLEDMGNKKALCAKLGVEDYFVFDSEGEYLDPRLQGFHLEAGQYRPARAASDGSLQIQSLDLRVCIDGDVLRFVDVHSGRELVHTEELERRAEEAARLYAEEARLRQEEARLHQEQARRLRAAEAEIKRLRGELDK